METFEAAGPGFAAKSATKLPFLAPVSHRFGSWWRCRRERLCLRRRWRWSWCHDRGVGTRQHLVRFPANLLPGASWLGTLSRRILVLGLPGFPNSPHSPFLLWTDILLGRPKVTTWSYYAVCRGPPKKNNDHQNQIIWSVIAISQDHQFSERRWWMMKERKRGGRGDVRS